MQGRYSGRLLAVFLALFCFVVATGQALAADKPIVWRMQTVAPAGSDEYNWMPKDFVDTFNALAGGRMKIELYAAGALMKSGDVPEGVSKGVMEMGHTYLSYFGGREKGFDAASEWAADGHPMQGVMWFYEDEGASIMRPIAERHNLYYLGVSAILGEHVWSKKPLRSLDDVKGLKMRAQALAGEIFNKLGAATVTMPGEEVYPSLQRGVIDAAEYISDIVNYGQGLHEVTKYVIFPSYSGGGSVDWIVNLKAWKALPADLQQKLDLALRVTNFNYWNKSVEGERDVQNKMRDYGMEFITWSDKDMDTLTTARIQIMREKAAKNEDYKKRFESQMKFLKKLGYTPKS